MTRAAVLPGALFALAVCGAPAVPPARDVDLAVQFTLTDLDDKPIADAPVRVVFGSDPDWRSPGAGHRLLTDARGESHFTARVRLDTHPRNLPTNFADSLVSQPQLTDHLMVATELPYMTYHWLYVADLYRFPHGGDVLLDRFTVYTPDAHGRFTDEAREDGDGWRMPELGGLVLTAPGHEMWDHLLEPDPADPAGAHWRLKVAFKRSPPPIRR